MVNMPFWSTTKNLVIASVCRPPTGDIDEMQKELENSIENIAHKHGEIFIKGDFNINFKENSEEKRKLNSCLKGLGQNQLSLENNQIK